MKYLPLILAANLIASDIPEEIVDNIYKQIQTNNWKDLYYDVLPQVINDMGYTNVLEIGVALGGHAETLLMNTQIETYYGVDPYLTYKNDGFSNNISKLSSLNPQQNFDYLYTWVSQIRLSPFTGRYQLIRKPSIEAAELFADESLDCIFIDGDHATEAVLADLAAWFPKVKRGHLILGDDYYMESVSLAVDYFFKQQGVEPFFFTSKTGYKIWAVYKPNETQ